MFEELPFDFDCQEVYSQPIPSQEPLPNHIQYKFGGIHVQFPYVAYPSQKDMMSKMIEGMNAGTNALLESPTGTGKTAALLCASLAWQKKKIADITKNYINRTRSPLKKCNNGGPPRSIEPYEKTPLIIYASRTHSQLKQVVDQLKKTAYANTQMVVLASRKHFCINQVAIESKSLEDTCSKMCANSNIEADALKELPERSPPFKKTRLSPSSALDSPGKSHSNIRASCRGAGPSFVIKEEDAAENKFPTCPYYTRDYNADAQMFNSDPFRTEAPWDIEELKSFGRREKSCPYFLSKELMKSATLILCNYNHLLHPWIRKALKLDVKGSIVIFDEAHNIESTCMDIASKVVDLHTLTDTQDGILPNLDKEMKNPDVPNEYRDALKKLQRAFKHLRQWIDDNKDDGEFEILSNKINSKCSVKKIENPLEEFSQIGFSADEIRELQDCLQLLSKPNAVSDENRTEYACAYKCDTALVTSMSSLIFPFRTLFWKDGDEHSNLSNYSVDLMKEIDKRKSPTEYGLTLHLTCLNPYVLFKDMKCARSIIVTSGTLTPIDSFTSELGITFTHKLSAPHVINSKQLWAGIITKHRDNEEEEPLELKFTYDNMNNPPKFHQHAHALGQLLLRISKIIPHGVLVFCTSKDVLQRLRNFWESNEDDFLHELKKLKELFFEDKIKPSEFQDEIVRYRECAEGSPKGAMLFAVFKGSVSEGVDFADNHARAVVTVGIPHLPVFDIKVMRKKDFNNRMSKINESYKDGREWYHIQAYRALNQALGRCVRHKGDWGAIFMVDSRCASSKKISKWVQDYMQGHGAFHDFELKLNAFIADRSNEMDTL